MGGKRQTSGGVGPQGYGMFGPRPDYSGATRSGVSATPYGGQRRLGATGMAGLPQQHRPQGIAPPQQIAQQVRNTAVNRPTPAMRPNTPGGWFDYWGR